MTEEPNSWFLLIESLKWLVPDPLRGSWIFYQTERVWVVFRSLMFCQLSKITVTSPKSVKVNEWGHFWLAQIQKNEYQLLIAQSQQNDYFENLYISTHGEARNIKFGQQLNLIKRIPLGILPQEVVAWLAHNHLTNLFTSSYRGAAVKFGQ